MIPWWGWGLSVLLIVGIIAFYTVLCLETYASFACFFCFAGFGIISRGGDTTKRTVCRTTSEVISEQQPSIVEEKYKTNRLTEEECKELHKKLVAYVEKEKPYINPDLKMGGPGFCIGYFFTFIIVSFKPVS